MHLGHAILLQRRLGELDSPLVRHDIVRDDLGALVRGDFSVAAGHLFLRKHARVHVFALGNGCGEQRILFQKPIHCRAGERVRMHEHEQERA